MILHWKINFILDCYQEKATKLPGNFVAFMLKTAIPPNLLSNGLRPSGTEKWQKREVKEAIKHLLGAPVYAIRRRQDYAGQAAGFAQ